MPAQNILEQWVQLIQQLQRGVTYEEVTDEERREIIRGLMGGSYEFETRGHFYQCRNGHVYTIGDCGGAMEESRFPECGCIIGGQDHTLNNTNARAITFENLAREEGMADSPWAWGRGA